MVAPSRGSSPSRGRVAPMPFSRLASFRHLPVICWRSARPSSRNGASHCRASSLPRCARTSAEPARLSRLVGAGKARRAGSRVHGTPCLHPAASWQGVVRARTRGSGKSSTAPWTGGDRPRASSRRTPRAPTYRRPAARCRGTPIGRTVTKSGRDPFGRRGASWERPVRARQLRRANARCRARTRDPGGEPSIGSPTTTKVGDFASSSRSPPTRCGPSGIALDAYGSTREMRVLRAIR